jgi:hypothetical protein
MTETNEKSLALWSRETTRRLTRQILRPGPGFTTFELVMTANPAEPDFFADPDETDADDLADSMLEDMLSIVLNHHFYGALLAENPQLTEQLADLSYDEALRVVYHHQHDA